MNAVIVCVDYADFLAVTLPRNRHHFERVLVVTSFRDSETRDLTLSSGCALHATNAFYSGGALFNKAAALEEALDACQFRAPGWLAILDADIVWPQDLGGWQPEAGKIHVPWRRMQRDLRKWPEIMPEPQWKRLGVHHVRSCHSGYSQVFRTDDPVLLAHGAPWHEVDWRHAGGADTHFSELWPQERRVRPRWEVLHLGDAGANWCGRATARVDDPEKREPEGAARALADLQAMMAERRRREREGEADRYGHERLS